MTEYVFWAMFTLLGYGIGWLIHGRGSETAQNVIPAPHEAPALPRGDWIAGDNEGPAPFRVVTLDGMVCYEGSSGSLARKHIELLRSQEVEWRSYRDGIPWDHGPREAP